MTYTTTPGGASMIAERDKQALIPNSFPTPNAYIDRLMPLLTSDEFKLLMYAVRRIYGFQKRVDRIAMRQFSAGVVTKSGEQLDGGTGLAERTCRKGVHSLESFRIFLRTAENDPRYNQGAEYGLQQDASAIDWEGLYERAGMRAEADRERAAKARGGVVAGEGVSDSRGGCRTAGGAGLSHSPHKSQGKPGKAREWVPIPAKGCSTAPEAPKLTACARSPLRTIRQFRMVQILRLPIP